MEIRRAEIARGLSVVVFIAIKKTVDTAEQSSRAPPRLYQLLMPASQQLIHRQGLKFLY